MERLFCITQLGSKCNHNGPYKMKGEGDLTTQIRRKWCDEDAGRFEGAKLMALKLEEGAMNQGM